MKLRKDLLLGVATAATQIEGGDTNNTWYDWTKNHDKTKDGTTSLLANSHWENYKEHINLMEELHLQIYRFSIEWSRIEPSEGVFDEEAINHYIDEIKYLLEKGIKPLVTLHHFSNPIWFEKKGGFKKKKYAVECFKRYTRYVVEHLSPYVNEWCTINEPNVYAVNTFMFGQWLNEERSFFTTMKVLRSLGKCHVEAYKLIHEIQKDARVGIALNITYFEPKRPHNLLDKIGTWFHDRGFNLAIGYAMGYDKLIFPLGFSRRKGEYFDYLGINYYTTNVVKRMTNTFPDNRSYNDLGWAITPDNFRKALLRFHKLFNKDVYITENGTPDKVDAFRPQYIRDHLYALSDLEFVKRYYYWTFMDNFEWKEGQGPCFGIVEYHYEDKTYTPRPSAYLFKEIIDKHEITEEMMERYGIKENKIW